MIYDLYEINVDSGCQCQYTEVCVHQFRTWSQLWFQGVGRRMPLVMTHPAYLFRTKA